MPASEMLDEKAIFNVARKIDSPAARAEYLQQVCGDDGALSERVGILLQAYQVQASFLELPPAGCTAPTLDQPPCELPGALIGPYKLLEQIGEGGMGLVYMAEQQQPVRRLVALKIIKPGMDSKQVIARFEAERQALAMMDHPNIAKIFDAGTVGQSTKSEARNPKRIQSTKQEAQNEESAGHGPFVSDIGPSNLEFVSDFEFRASNLSAGRPYFVMELVRGLPINEFCDQKRLAVRERLQLFIQVCQAVQHAHQKGIIHRDLKPTNVLVAMADTVAFPKLLDFGIAKALGGTLATSTSHQHSYHTGYSQLVGTPLYMSPEQAEMNVFGVDTRSDVYSLGVLLYELLTGTTPFDKDRLKSATFDEMRRIIREEEPETVSQRIARTKSSRQAPSAVLANDGTRSVPTTYGELDWIVMKALEKDRSRRYESASAFATDIQRYLSDEPVLACPPTTMYRFQKFARKHKPAFATATAIALCLLLGTTVSAWQAVRATTATAEANANEAQAKQATAAEALQRQRAEANEQKANEQRDEVQALNEKLRRTLYASNMNLAKHAWDAGNSNRVQDLLQQHKVADGETDLRDFEWHYLHRLCNSELLKLHHDAEVRSVAYSPDGRRLVSASEGVVKVWDARTGKQLNSFQSQWTYPVWFTADGKRLISGGRHLKEWDAESGREIRTLKPDIIGWAVDYSASANRVAAGRNDIGTRKDFVSVWDVKTGQELFTHEGFASAVALSPDGKFVASGGWEPLKIRDVQSGKELLDLGIFPAGETRCLAFAPGGKLFAAARGDATKVWVIESGKEHLSLGPAREVAFSQDGTQLVGSGVRQGVTIWNLETGKAVRTFKGAGSHAILSPDGQRTASIVGNAVKIWDALKDQESTSQQRAAGQHSPDGRLVASVIDNMIIQLKETATGQEIARLTGHTVPVRTLAFSPDSKVLASGGGGHTNDAGAFGVSTDSKAELRVWDVATGKERFNLPVSNGNVFSIVFNPDGKSLAAAAYPPPYEGEVKVWNLTTGHEIFVLKTRILSRLVYSPDGKLLAFVSNRAGQPRRSGSLMLYDAATGRELQELKGNITRQTPAFSSDGKQLAAGGNQGAIVWKTETGEQRFTLKGHASEVRSVAFHPAGTRMVTCSADDTIKLWDGETGQELLTLQAPSIISVEFSPNGHRLIAHSTDRTIIYDATPLPKKP